MRSASAWTARSRTPRGACQKLADRSASRAGPRPTPGDLPLSPSSAALRLATAGPGTDDVIVLREEAAQPGVLGRRGRRGFPSAFLAEGLQSAEPLAHGVHQPENGVLLRPSRPSNRAPRDTSETSRRRPGRPPGPCGRRSRGAHGPAPDCRRRPARIRRESRFSSCSNASYWAIASRSRRVSRVRVSCSFAGTILGVEHGVERLPGFLRDVCAGLETFGRGRGVAAPQGLLNPSSQLGTGDRMVGVSAPFIEPQPLSTVSATSSPSARRSLDSCLPSPNALQDRPSRSCMALMRPGPRRASPSRRAGRA